LSKQDIKTTTTFDSGINESMDEVGKVIQSLESDTIVDTTSPVLSVGTSKKLTQTDVELELEKEIKKELPIEKDPIDVKIITPDDEPDYIPSPNSGGGGGGRGGSEIFEIDERTGQVKSVATRRNMIAEK